MQAIWSQWSKKWRVFGLTFATSLAVLSGVSAISAPAMAHAAHAAAKSVATGCRTVAEEKAYLYAHGQKEMANSLKTVSCAGSSAKSRYPKWSLATTKSSWGGYISDTLNQTNTNESFAHYVLRSSSDNTYHTATWVGVGGWNGAAALLQGGVDLANREMWWEALNSNGTVWGEVYETGFQGNVNDLYDTWVERTGVGVWEVISQGITAGHAFDFGSQPFSPDHTSAEWVMEWAGLGQPGAGYVPSLSNSVPFTDVWFDDINYTQHNVAYANTFYESELDYTSGGGSCIKAGTLTNDTSTYSHFTDTWANSGC